jgi:hypothetical protein
MIKTTICLNMIVYVVLLLAAIPFIFLLFLSPHSSVHTSPKDIPVIQYRADHMCCPKVFLYDPSDILQRVQRLQAGLKLTDLDPLNTDAVVFHQFNNESVSDPERIPLLTEVLRWLPDVPNRPLKHEDQLFKYNSNSRAMLFYSKDYVHTFHLRLAISGCVVADPADAELFVVPISIHTDHPYGKKKGFQEEWDAFFSKLTDFQQIFQHLTPATAQKHVIFSSSFGHSRHSVGLWSPPYNDPKVSLMQRVALGSDLLIRQSYGSWLKYVMQTPERVISAPFSALLTFPDDLLNTTAHKSILVSAFFEFHGKAKALRQSLNDMCETSVHCWNKNKLISMQNSTRSKMQLVASFLEAKKESTFCLEPEGDWPTRQSMVQDVLVTCIPVFFSGSFARLWGPSWGNFIGAAAVQLDGAAVLSGDLDVLATLRAISADEIREKQRLLRRHREQMLYLHMNDYIQDGNNYKHKCTVDASNLLLQELLLHSK